jgi:hypothetical protein
MERGRSARDGAASRPDAGVSGGASRGNLPAERGGGPVHCQGCCVVTPSKVRGLGQAVLAERREVDDGVECRS